MIQVSIRISSNRDGIVAIIIVTHDTTIDNVKGDARILYRQMANKRGNVLLSFVCLCASLHFLLCPQLF